MTKEEKRQYLREYRAEGFGKISDRRYYIKNVEKLREKSRLRYLIRKAKKVSRENSGNLNNTK